MRPSARSSSSTIGRRSVFARLLPHSVHTRTNSTAQRKAQQVRKRSSSRATRDRHRLVTVTQSPPTRKHPAAIKDARALKSLQVIYTNRRPACLVARPNSLRTATTHLALHHLQHGQSMHRQKAAAASARLTLVPLALSKSMGIAPQMHHQRAPAPQRENQHRLPHDTTTTATFPRRTHQTLVDTHTKHTHADRGRFHQSPKDVTLTATHTTPAPTGCTTPIAGAGRDSLVYTSTKCASHERQYPILAPALALQGIEILYTGGLPPSRQAQSMGTLTRYIPVIRDSSM